MSYEPLHHKYRPQTFKDLVGQEAIAKTLTNAIVTQRIAPAYLFTGPRGTGKTSSARILAKSLNCLSSEQPTPKPCGLCEVCREIAGGYALDVMEIDAASNTGVDNIREIIEKTQFAPARCRYKVYIIDEVHMLSTAAFNALLKTLEEPPARVVFVLATTDPQRVLPTIISRCQRFDFRRIPLEGMVAHLQAIASQENIDITAQAITLVAQVAQGGLRDAESLLDQLSLLTGQVTVEAVWDLVGAVPERDLMVLAKAIADDNSETVLDQCRRLMDKGREPLIILQNLAGFYRDLLIARTAPSRSGLVAVTPPTWNQLCELSQQLEVTNILQSQQHLKNSEVQIKNTTQPRLWLEVTLLGLLPSANSQQIGALDTKKTGTQVNRGATASTTPQTALPNQKRPNIDSSISNQSNKEVIQPASPQTSEAKQQQPSTVEINPSSNGVATAANLPPATPVPAVQTSKASLSETPVAAAPEAEQAVREKNVNVHSAAFEEISQQVIEHLRLPAMKALWHQHCYLLRFEGAVAYVGVKSQPLLNLAQSKLSSIEAAFESAFQSPVKVELLLQTSSKSSNNSSRESASTTTKFVESESKSKVTQLANHSETQERHKETREDSIGT
ncbi:MAG: DNA polymerase III subunit gamma/tau, partial [Symploca sp. SIO1A3]|nr:DNA polymerase III subunit gamma/tau [Symploca sp. SIO1A3]